MAMLRSPASGPTCQQADTPTPKVTDLHSSVTHQQKSNETSSKTGGVDLSRQACITQVKPMTRACMSEAGQSGKTAPMLQTYTTSVQSTAYDQVNDLVTWGRSCKRDGGLTFVNRYVAFQPPPVAPTWNSTK